jgi:hypothetical protein
MPDNPKRTTAGGSAHMPIGTPARGPSAKLSQATSATRQGAAAATAAQRSLTTRRVR